MRRVVKIKQTRNTVQRQIVLQAALALKNHPTADDVYERVASEHPSISKATVYRNLNQLAQQGDIRKVKMANGADRFDFRTDEHAHVSCKCCGSVFDVQLAGVDQLLSCVEDSSGVTLTRYDILFEGICADCQRGSETTAS